MDNIAPETGSYGFSRLPQNEEFIEDMRRQLGKNLKYALIAIPIIIVIITVIAAIINKVKGYGTDSIIITFAVLLVLFFFIAICMCISYFVNLGRLKKDSIDGTVIKKEKWHTARHEDNVRKTKYRIVLRTDEGKKIKVKDAKALAVFPYINEGSKVRFHPGYPFPLEFYDKSQNNVCVFCGMHESGSAKKCSRCGKPMLI